MDINGFENYVIDEVTICDRYNEHCTCDIAIVADESQVQEILHKYAVGQGELCISNEGELVFIGVVKSISCKKTYLKTIIYIRGVSYSESMEDQKQKRVFQNTKKTVKQIIESFQTNKVLIQCLDETIANKTIEHIVVQNKEDDFAFLKRFAAMQDCVWYIDTKNRSRCSMKMCSRKKGNAHHSVKVSKVQSMEVEYAPNNELVQVVTTELFDIGSAVELYGKEYIVASREIIQKYEDIKITYQFVQKLATQEEEVWNDEFNMGLANVVSNCDETHFGQIQVDLVEYENCLTDNRVWIDYVTPLSENDGGIVVIPDAGEQVEIIFRNGVCIALGCVRKKKINETIQNVNNRSFLIRGCNCIISENDLQFNIGSNNCRITDQSIELCNDKIRIAMNENQCMIGFDDSRIIIENNTIQLVGKNKIESKSKNTEITGDTSVKIKTKAFDVG